MINNRFQQGKLLSEVSTFGIGGPARYYIEAKTVEDLQECIAYCSQNGLPYHLIGKGSNTLFDDRGFNGLAILNKIIFCEYGDRTVSVGAGYSFSLLGAQTARKGWAGLEFASGIPASVGGAVYMNAGANGAETADCLTEVVYIAESGEKLILPKDKLEFSYRHSSFQKMKGAIASAAFQLKPSPEARQKQLSIIEYRTRTQPYGDKSAGCVFRNPGASPAGALIQQSGLKGLRIGGAEVSPLHANFIVNRDKASARDVLELAKHIQKTVKEKTGIELDMEIRLIPYE